jgi:hypothetical protein
MVVVRSILVLQQEKGHQPAWQRFSNSFLDKYLCFSKILLRQQLKIRIRKAKLSEMVPESGKSIFIWSRTLELVINKHNYGKNVTFILSGGTYL